LRDLRRIEAEGESDEPTVAGGGYLRAIVDQAAVGRTTRDGIPLEQILRDRPDVFAAYFREFHSPNNDTHSDAWVDRVGGVTVQDYANYWYERHGRWEGYGSRTEGSAGAPDEGGGPRLPPGIVETGRLTSDGVPLSQILADRPDVFRAFFTEYYGRNNDHQSSAWMDRVGGATPEDYANYWYERHGKWGDYVARTPDPVGAVDQEPIGAVDQEPTPAEDPEPPPEATPWPDDLADDGVLSVGRGLNDIGSDLFG
jgi:hypothetical protein